MKKVLSFALLFVSLFGIGNISLAEPIDPASVQTGQIEVKILTEAQGNALHQKLQKLSDNQLGSFVGKVSFQAQKSTGKTKQIWGEVYQIAITELDARNIVDSDKYKTCPSDFSYRNDFWGKRVNKKGFDESKWCYEDSTKIPWTDKYLYVSPNYASGKSRETGLSVDKRDLSNGHWYVMQSPEYYAEFDKNPLKPIQLEWSFGTGRTLYHPLEDGWAYGQCNTIYACTYLFPTDAKVMGSKRSDIQRTIDIIRYNDNFYFTDIWDKPYDLGRGIVQLWLMTSYKELSITTKNILAESSVSDKMKSYTDCWEAIEKRPHMMITFLKMTCGRQSSICFVDWGNNGIWEAAETLHFTVYWDASKVYDKANISYPSNLFQIIKGGYYTQENVDAICKK